MPRATRTLRRYQIKYTFPVIEFPKNGPTEDEKLWHKWLDQNPTPTISKKDRDNHVGYKEKSK